MLAMCWLRVVLHESESGGEGEGDLVHFCCCVAVEGPHVGCVCCGRGARGGLREPLQVHCWHCC